MMIFGQANRDHEKGSLYILPDCIRNHPHMFAKYRVVPNANCVMEIEEKYFSTPLHSLFNVGPKIRKVASAATFVYLKGDALICHPTVAKDIERSLSAYTASLLDSLED